MKESLTLHVSCRKWLGLMLPLVMGVVVFYAVTENVTPVYQSTATLRLRWDPTNPGRATYSDFRTAQQLLPTVKALVFGDRVVTAAGVCLESGTDDEQLRQHLYVGMSPHQAQLQVTAQASDPAQAVAMTAALAAELARIVENGFPGLQLELLDEPETAAAPAYPNLAVVRLMALAASTVLMVAGLAWWYRGAGA